ncbi:MAG: class I SAM-dependent methyltransferase [Gammaproteobacteria bacterium]|nr:class I SAM-dependent methyltransferase [Gammaproteobacteria bacterium]
MDVAKKQVYDFWNEASCGEQLYLSGTEQSDYLAQMRKRYQLEPYIESFAQFVQTRNQDVLEIGIGLGADHQRFAQAGARLTGIDLTERAVQHTRKRLNLFGLESNLQVADAESLPFTSESYDLVYSWGVLHHSPNTDRAIDEVWRILRYGGAARIMIYNKYSLVGYMLWLRYALLTAQPWTGLNAIYAKYLESPGTKAYTLGQARILFRRFSNIKIHTVLTHGDLLESAAGQRHRSWLLSAARRIWPRRFIKSVLPNHGLFMLIEAIK